MKGAELKDYETEEFPKIEIGEATNFDELYDAIRQKEMIISGKTSYTPEELIYTIEKLRTQFNPDLDIITRAEGLRKKVSELLEKNKVDKKEKELTPEEIEKFSDYINEGGELIKKEEYAKAIKHFIDEKNLKKMNWKFDNEVAIIKNSNLASREYEKRLLNSIRLRTIVSPEEKIVRLVLPELMNRNDSLPSNLQHEVSLIFMEEWLHVLQDIQGKPLAELTDKIGNNNMQKGEINEGEINEIDVALYMRQLGIPLTEDFLNYYGRREALEELENKK